MASPYIGEIRIFAGTFAPVGWALCDGKLYSIAENETLYTLIGTAYGGDGSSTFAVPDFRSRVPIGSGQSKSGQVFAPGNAAGSEQVTLSENTLPPHSHDVNTVSSEANAATPLNTLPAGAPSTLPAHYVTAAKSPVRMAPAAIGSGGGAALPISVVQPVQALNFIIAMTGIYPSPQ